MRCARRQGQGVLLALLARAAKVAVARPFNLSASRMELDAASPRTLKYSPHHGIPPEVVAALRDTCGGLPLEDNLAEAAAQTMPQLVEVPPVHLVRAHKDRSGNSSILTLRSS